MERQLIFIDDSGDPGFKLEKSSSRFLVVACIIFDSKVDADFANLQLKTFKQRLGWKKEREFKFHRANDNQKKMFFDVARKFNFKIRAVAIDKTKIDEPRLRNSESFYGYTIQMVLNDYKDMNLAQVFLDGGGSKNFRKRSTAQLRRTLNENNRRMVSFRLVDSRDNLLIQLADMVAGAIHAKCDKTKRLKCDYLRVIKDKVDDIRYIR